MPDERILEITTGTVEQFEKGTSRDLEKIEKGGEGSEIIFFEEPSRLRKILTEKRQELIQEIMEHPPESIRDLAESLGRGLREVHEDVHLLESYRILSLEEGGSKKRPRIPYDRIRIEIELPIDREPERVSAVS